MRALDPIHGARLARAARSAIREALQGPNEARDPALAEPYYQQKSGTFVTLYRGERLHGCIGSLEPRLPLVLQIEENAVAAAIEDPRARPLRVEDVGRLRVEISVLSPLVRVPCQDEASAIAALVPHEDGVVLRLGMRRATFLPQVWESLPEPRVFLAELREKAGLRPDLWPRELEVFRYHVEKHVEPPEDA